MAKWEQMADMFCNSIRALAENEERLDNMRSYLSRHFDKWLEKYANTPDGIVSELYRFADI